MTFIKKIIIVALILVTLSLIVYSIFFIPRNLKIEDFEKLKYGEPSLFVLAKLGKSDEISVGSGSGLYYFHYLLPDDTTVVLAFGPYLSKLTLCRYVKGDIEIDIITPY